MTDTKEQLAAESNSVFQKHLDEKAEHNVIVSAIDRMPDSVAALSEEERVKAEKKLVRKIDILIMPIFFIMYILNYLDRNNISSAKLANIEEDLNMDASQYQTVISILFVGYVLCQTPSNLIMSKVKWPAKYICGVMSIWGLLSAMVAACNSYGGLLAIRILLGVAEAAFFPGAVFHLSCWYTKKELATRIAFLYSGSQLGNAFGSLLAIAILNLDGVHGIAGWKWLFLIEGVATFGIALIFAIILPDFPHNSKQLTQNERDLAVWRLESEAGATEAHEDSGAKESFIRAVKDIKVWIFTGILSLTYVAGAVNSFFPSVVDTLGYGRNETYLLNAPPFVFACICIWINGWHSDKTGEKFWHIVIPLAVTILSMILAIVTTNVPTRYIAMMLMPGSFYSAAIVILSWISLSIPRPASKRAAALAIINSFANTPNIWCPYLYYAPKYLAAFTTNIGAVAIGILLTVFLRIFLARQNALMDKGEYHKLQKEGPSEEQIAMGWRYVL